MNYPGAVNKFQSLQNLVGQFLDVVDGKASVSDVEKEVQISAERLMDEEMVVAVVLTELEVIQCLPNILFSCRFAGLSRFG